MTLFHLLRHGERQGVGCSPAACRGSASPTAAAPRSPPSPNASPATGSRRSMRAPCSAPARAPRSSPPGSGSPIEFRDDLIELDFGEWTGATFDAIRADPHWEAWRTHRSLASIPGGESMRAGSAPRRRGACRIGERHHGEDAVVVVSHGDVIRAGLVFALGMPLDYLRPHRSRPGLDQHDPHRRRRHPRPRDQRPPPARLARRLCERRFGGGDAGFVGAVRGREEIERAGFAGKEQAVVDRCGEPGAVVGMAGPRIGIGAAGERIPRHARTRRERVEAGGGCRCRRARPARRRQRRPSPRSRRVRAGRRNRPPKKQLMRGRPNGRT